MNDDERRQQDLKRKRQELEELRRSRQQNRRPIPTENGENHLAAPAAQNGSLSASNSAKDLGSILESVGLQNIPPLAPQSASNGSLDSYPVSESVPSTAPGTQRPVQLELVTVNPGISIAPKNDNKYSKTTQTIDVETHLDGFSTGSRDEFEFDEMSFGDRGMHLDDMSLDDTSPSHALAKILGRETQPHEASQQVEDVQPIKPPKPPELTQEQKEKILGSESLQRFINRSSRWIERAIAAEKDQDIFADYTSSRKENITSDASLTVKGRFNEDSYFTDQRGSAVDLSDEHPELLAVAVNGSATDAPDGLVNVWNTNFRTLECSFDSNSVITSMCFAKYHPKLIIGGCSTGQVCVWDMRSNKRNPVSKSQISARAHTQGITQIQVAGTQSSHDLVTTSLDGIICFWSLDNLHSPTEKITTSFGPKKSIPICNVSFDQNDATKFIIGGEDGFVCIGSRHESDAKAITKEFPAHKGAITCIQSHRASGPVDFSRYFLTSSMDFTCKLWNLANTKKPVFSFDCKHGSYVSTVSWSPVHPATFVSTSLSGVLNLWNLNTDVEEAIATQRSGKAICSAIWSNDGRQIAAMDESGVVQLYSVHKSLYSVPPSEWETFSNVCREAVVEDNSVQQEN